MAIPVWPVGTLGPIRGRRDAFRAGINRAPQLVEFDDGPSGARPQGYYVETQMMVSLPVKAANLQTLMNFIRNDLRMASSRFTASIIGPNQTTLVTKVCRITDVAQVQPSGLDWMVDLKLLVYDW